MLEEQKEGGVNLSWYDVSYKDERKQPQSSMTTPLDELDIATRQCIQLQQLRSPSSLVRSTFSNVNKPFANSHTGPYCPLSNIGSFPILLEPSRVIGNVKTMISREYAGDPLFELTKHHR
jgi:hypothetical protein